MLFLMLATLLNAIGLITAVAVWIERQQEYAAAIGLVMMLVGTGIFLLGQLTQRPERERAKRIFIQRNIWVLSFIPLACIWNVLDGLLGGYSGMLAPLPLLGNSYLRYGLFWLVYLAACGAVSIFVQKKK